MSRIEKLERGLLKEPAAFRFSDLETIMLHHGFELDTKGKTSGSRVRFYRASDKRMLIMHAPHPGSELSGASVKFAARFVAQLKREGHA